MGEDLSSKGWNAVSFSSKPENSQKMWKSRLMKMTMLWSFYFLIKHANDHQAFRNHMGGIESLL